MTKLRSLLAAALLVAAVVAGAAAIPASAQDAPTDDGSATGSAFTHSWSVAPAGSTDPNQPGNRPSFSYDGAPGTTIEDAVTVSNFGNVQLTFDLYATDAYNTATGEIALLEKGQEPTDVGTWVTFGQDALTVPPGMAFTVPMTITIPADARPGDHVGGVVASAPAPVRSPDGAQFEIDRRIGPQLYVRVAGPLEPELAVEDLGAGYGYSLNPLSGGGDVTFRVQNTGNVRASGEYTVTMAGPFGLMGRTVTGTVPELIPGQGLDVTASVDGVPAGIVDTAEVELTMLPADGGGEPATSSSSVRALAVPVAIVALVVIALLIAFGVSRYRRHDRGGSTGPGAGGGPPGGSRPPATGRQLAPPRALESPVLQGHR